MPIETGSQEVTASRGSAEPLGRFEGRGLVWILLVVFMGGVALNLTPCVYPLIPITVSYFGGKAGQRRGELVIHGLCYLVGLAAMNTGLGVTAALGGSMLGSALQNPWVLGLVAAMLVAFAMSLLGVWEFRMPQGLTNAAARSYAGYGGSFALGLTLGIVAAPCLGPFVLGLLTWIASTGSPWLGGMTFLFLSLGLGIPLFVLALFSGSLDRLPRSGEWMIWVRKAMGWVLLGMAAHFVRPVLSPWASSVLLGGVGIAAGVHLGWLVPTRGAFRGFPWIKGIAGAAAIVFGTAVIGAQVWSGRGVSWKPFSDELLAEARQSGRSLIIDFSAAWCTPCRELDAVTFRHPEVVREAESNFIMVKVDLTGKGDTEAERLVSRFGVKGVPTVVFLDHEGRERSDLRLVDFVSAEELLSRMAQMREGKKTAPQGAQNSIGGSDVKGELLCQRTLRKTLTAFQ